MWSCARGCVCLFALLVVVLFGCGVNLTNCIFIYSSLAIYIHNLNLWCFGSQKPWWCWNCFILILELGILVWMAFCRLHAIILWSRMKILLWSMFLYILKIWLSMTLFFWSFMFSAITHKKLVFYMIMLVLQLVKRHLFASFVSTKPVWLLLMDLCRHYDSKCLSWPRIKWMILMPVFRRAGLALGSDVLVHCMVELCKMNQKDLRNHATRHRIKVCCIRGPDLIQELSYLRSLTFWSATVVAAG